jgi:hypothetical protein
MKVLYTISLLRDGAFNWIQPILQKSWEGRFSSKLYSFTALRVALEKRFGEFDAEAATEKKLEKLR